MGTRINREIRSGKYRLIMFEGGEMPWLDPRCRPDFAFTWVHPPAG